MRELFEAFAAPIFAPILSLFGREVGTARDGIEQNSVFAVVERIDLIRGAINASEPSGFFNSLDKSTTWARRSASSGRFPGHALLRAVRPLRFDRGALLSETVRTRCEIAWCRVKRCCICRQARAAIFDGRRASDQKATLIAVCRRDLCGKDGDHADASIASQSRSRHLSPRHSKI
jgi:hypothetical protein